MKADELLKSWPSRGPEREDAIIKAVENGYCQPIEWQRVDVSRMGHRCVFWVARDALRLGEPGDLVRVNVTARTAQRLADMLGGTLPTTFLIDEVIRQFGAKVPPCIQPPDRSSRVAKGLSPAMDDIDAMRYHSAAIDAAISKLADPPYIVMNAGKHWVLTNRLQGSTNKSANYGWFTKGAPYVSASGVKLWQPLGTAHNDRHVDYSQTLQLVRGVVEIDGVAMSFARAAAHSELWWVLSDEGPLKVTRMPSVPPSEPIPTPSSAGGFTTEEHGTIPDALDDIVSDFMEAKNYTKVDRSKEIRYVVLHTAEIGETLTAAEALMRWCAGPNAPRASWHFAVDADSVTQSVKEEYIAWHAPGANRTGIGIETCGRAAQTAEQWHDDYSSAVLQRTARLVAYLCRRWNLPVQFVDAAGLKYPTRGITTHAEVTKAFKQSTHTDPGKGFPMEEFLRMVMERM